MTLRPSPIKGVHFGLMPQVFRCDSKGTNPGGFVTSFRIGCDMNSGLRRNGREGSKPSPTHEMQTNKLTLIAASNEFWTVLPPE